MRGGVYRGWSGVLLLAAAALTAAPAEGQRFAAELRAGGAVGNYTASGAGLELLPRLSVAASAEMRFTPTVSGYAALNRSSFGCADGFCATREHLFTSQGVAAGVRYDAGVFWGRAGLGVQALQIESDAVARTSDPALGIDLAAGLDLPLGRDYRLRPQISYLRHGAATATDDGHVAVLAIEVGVVMRFGR